MSVSPIDGHRDDLSTQADVVVAGHICLDIIPSWPVTSPSGAFQPGTLTLVGPAQVVTGGSVANTGQALHRLGAKTRLLAKIGDDAFGALIRDLISGLDNDLASGLLVAPGEHTSYSVILSQPATDRAVLHFSGANDTFSSADSSASAFVGARLFHFGYPPLMRRMYQDGGADLAGLFRRAKAAGLTTSLDMAYPDPASAAGHVDWRALLRAVLPFVDVFLPSLEEILIMLYPQQAARIEAQGSAALAQVPADTISSIGAQLLAWGAGIVGIKLGSRGFYLRTAGGERLTQGGIVLAAAGERWGERELWSSAFDAAIAGTTGAGDAAIAGFLFGLLNGMTPEQVITAACAVGAASTEAIDATAGVPGWALIQQRLDRGWRRSKEGPGAGWTESDFPGLWRGTCEVSDTVKVAS